MKKSVQLAVMFFWFAVFCANGQGSVQWLTSMGGTSMEDNYALIGDGAGNVYTAGNFSLTAVFGGYTLNSPAGANACVAKLSQGTGSVVWAKSYANTGSTAYALARDSSGNIFLAGTYYGNAVFDSYTLTSSGFSDGFVAKIDPLNGNVIWVSSINGSGDDTPYALVADSAGNIYAAGSFSGSTQCAGLSVNSAGSRDVFVLKLNASGSPQWLRNFGGPGIDEAHGLCRDSKGHIFCSGGFSGSASFGTSTLTAAGSTDIFVCKIDALSGNAGWAKQCGGSLGDYGIAVACDPSGYVYSTGFFASTAAFDTYTLNAASTNAFIARHDPVSGNIQWVKGYGSSGSNSGNSITADAGGNIYVCGNFSGSTAFGANMLTAYGGQDIFVLRSDAATGAEKGAQHFGNVATDFGRGICFDGGNIYASGVYSGSATFDSFHSTSLGSFDIFVLKIDNTIGLKENSFPADRVNCFPNPSPGVLNIEPEKNEALAFIIRDISGNILLQGQIASAGKIDLSPFAKGIYFLTLKNDSGTIIKKIIRN